MQLVNLAKPAGSEEFLPLMLVMSGNPLIRSLHDMATVLILAWPSDDGEKYLIAVKTCLDALCGDLPAREARDALVHAADEAGILALEVAGGPSQPPARSK
jgi:hypothetical protein